jgi:hypothetical protein
MKNRLLKVGILAFVLVFGMMVLGCEEEEKSEPYPQSIMIQVGSSSWNSTNGSVEIWFQPPVLVAGKNYTGTPAKVSVGDLQWLQTSGINLELFNANSRNVSISSIEKREGGDTAIVKLNLTRTTAPSGESGTATVLITLPNDFTAKYPDGITWGNKTFQF